jgi:hypothetical protein
MELIKKSVLKAVDADVLQKLADRTENKQFDIINRNEYTATILWSVDDIKSQLRSRGIPDTDENVDAVLEELDVDYMEDCSDGWEVIDRAIDRASFPDKDDNEGENKDNE